MKRDLPELLTIKQASKLLNCHPNTLRLWEKKGVLRAVRFGIRRDRRYSKDDLLKLLNQDNELEKNVLPTDYDLTRIDMTGTQYEGLNRQALAHYREHPELLDKKAIDHFDFKNFLKQYNSRIRDFPPQEMEKYTALSEKILHIITAERYRNGSLETINLEKYQVDFIDRIEYFIKRNEPIRCMLPAFPFKVANPLKSTRGDTDLAEVASFCRFNEINLQIKKFYKPGAQIYVFHDGHLYYRHFLHEKSDADRYFDSLKKFIKELGLENVIFLRDAFEELKKIKEFSEICKEARKEMISLWAKGKFSNEKIQRIIQSAHNNVCLSDIPYDILYKINFSEPWDLKKEEKKLKDEIDRRAEKCAFEYMVVQHALEKVDFFNKMVPHGVRFTVHPKEGQIGIFLVKRKTHLLPWMGVGVLKNNGEASVHYESELISSGKYYPVFIKGEKYPFYYQEAEIIYQGGEEFERLFDNIVNSLDKNDFYWAFAFYQEYLDPKVKDILVDTHKKLADIGIEDRALCREDIFEIIKDAYKENSNIQIRPVRGDIPTGVIILKDRIVNLLWGNQPAAYEIKIKEIVERYQKYFRELWKKNT